MKKTWILVADSSRARIFSAETPNTQIQEIKSLSHSEGRLHEQNLSSDLPGKHADSASSSHHGLSENADLKKHEASTFAKQLCQELDAAHSNHVEQLFIVAEPAFLGLLREQLSSNTAKLVAFELDKNLCKEDAESIQHHLPNLASLAFSTN